jgi:Tfp pilus assembly protein PilF
MDAMRKVISLDPKHSNALNYLGYTYADLGKNLDEAERLILEAMKYKPDDGYITDSLGWVYYKKGEYEKALEYLQKAIGIVPDDPIMLEHLGDAYLKLNDKTNALKFYKKSLEHKEKDKEELEKKIRELTGTGS